MGIVEMSHPIILQDLFWMRMVLIIIY